MSKKTFFLKLLNGIIINFVFSVVSFGTMLLVIGVLSATWELIINGVNQYSTNGTNSSLLIMTFIPILISTIILTISGLIVKKPLIQITIK